MTSTKHTYEVQTVHDDRNFVETFECYTELEAKKLAQHYADQWRCTIELYRIALDDHPDEDQLICELEPAL